MSDGAATVGPPPEEVDREIDDLVRECADTCLWYQRRGYHPRTDAERWLVLDAIQKHADVRIFQRAARLKAWLSQRSSSASAGS